MFVSFGVLSMLWFFFTFEEIYFLGARFWFLLIVIGFIAWIVYIVRYARVTIPAMKEESEKGKDEDKYMPRKKSRK